MTAQQQAVTAEVVKEAMKADPAIAQKVTTVVAAATPIEGTASDALLKGNANAASSATVELAANAAAGAHAQLNPISMPSFPPEFPPRDLADWEKKIGMEFFDTPVGKYMQLYFPQWPEDNLVRIWNKMTPQQQADFHANHDQFTRLLALDAGFQLFFDYHLDRMLNGQENYLNPYYLTQRWGRQTAETSKERNEFREKAAKARAARNFGKVKLESNLSVKEENAKKVFGGGDPGSVSAVRSSFFSPFVGF